MTEALTMKTAEEPKTSSLKALRPRRFKDPLLDGPVLGTPPIPIYA